ncbi:MAG: hypothetical protein M9897_09925 [Brumimicrobium sp.]|nr:hypothetical protein [Brumimicrobium sp.]
MRKHISLWLILLPIFFLSCQSNPIDIPIPKNEINITYTNVDQVLSNVGLEEIKNEIPTFENQLGDLFYYELSQNIQQQLNDSSYIAVYNFYQQEYVKDIEIEKSKLVKTLPQHEEQINNAFHYFKYYFNSTSIPNNIFYINKLFSKINCTDAEISIGLENYISPESSVIKAIPEMELHNWQRQRMDIQYLKRDVLLSWIQVQLFEEIDGNLAEHLIQAGKILYVLNAVFPKESEAYILRYNEKEYKWAIENEAMTWDYLVREEMLFSNNLQTKMNFLNEGPKTVGLPDSSPDRIGQFIGYRIVKNYMLKNKSLSLQQLLKTKYNKILQTYEIQ